MNITFRNFLGVYDSKERFDKSLIVDTRSQSRRNIVHLRGSKHVSAEKILLCKRKEHLYELLDLTEKKIKPEMIYFQC